MASWTSLPEKERWQTITFIRVLGGAKPGSPRVPLTSEEAAAVGHDSSSADIPFADYRYEKPGTIRKITLKDLPLFATTSSGNGPQVVPRPENAWPQVLDGFKVEQYATGLNNPRLMRTAPNGDVFLAEQGRAISGCFGGISDTGKPTQVEVFANGAQTAFWNQLLSSRSESAAGLYRISSPVNTDHGTDLSGSVMS